MSDDFDLDRLRDIPDPLAGLALPPLEPRSVPAVRPRTRQEVARARTVSRALAVAVQGVWLALFEKRADLATVSRATLLGEVAFPLLAGAVALGAAVAPGARGLGEAKERLAPWALLAPVVFVAATWWSDVACSDPESFTWHALRCFFITSLFAMVPAMLAAWSFRRSFAAAPGWRAAALGMACAGLGASTMGLVCATGNVAHVLAGHGSVMLVAGLAGALLGRRFGEA
jgi:hypothetical protein